MPNRETSILSPETAPAHWYADPKFWPQERDGIFAKNWMFFCHESDVAEPLSYWAETLAGYPLLAVRDSNGVLRAFHNVCRHRAGPLVNNGSGVCDGHLTCAYHGWKYTLDGRLRLARDFGAKGGDFDPREYGLFPVRIDNWRGLLFVCLDDNAPDLSTCLAPLDARLGHKDWSGFKMALRREHALDCNWKTYVENYLEGYHIPNMHPTLDAELQSDAYEVAVEGKAIFHACPPRDETAVSEGLWGWVWPNIAINVYQKGLMIERMSPVGATKTRLDYVYLSDGGEALSAEALAMSDQVTAEDKWIVERVQENLNAGLYSVGRLSPKHEVGIVAFQGWIKDVLAAN